MTKQISGVVVLGIVCGVGCTPHGPGTNNRRLAEPDLGVIQTELDPRSLHLPLDRYQLTPIEQNQRSRARATLLSRCMRRFGFQLRLPAGDRPEQGLNAHRYGLTDESAAAEWGYHPPERHREETQPVKLDPAAKAVMGGLLTEFRGIRVPPGGCMWQAERQLTRGAQQANSNLVEDLSFLTLNRSEADSRVKALFASWSDCMHQAGYHYRSPWEANDDPEFHTERPSMSEIATAKADVQCKQEVGLVPAWAAVDAAYQRVAIARNLRRLRQVEDDLRTVLLYARKLGPSTGATAAGQR